MRATFVLLLTLAAQAQQQPTARVDFEVVSVKPGDPADPASSSRSSAGSMQWRNTTLKNLVRGAYGLNEFQLEGGPKWADSQRFHIDAKLPAGAERSQMQLMMQAMLADRFKLVFHRETKMLPEYELVVAPGGAKLEATSPDALDNQSSSQGDRHIKGKALTMANLASMLISAVGAPVVDRTGLTGRYTISLAFAPMLGTPRDDEPLPTILGVLPQQLGLKLEKTKGAVEVLVIDRAEQPAEN